MNGTLAGFRVGARSIALLACGVLLLAGCTKSSSSSADNVTTASSPEPSSSSRPAGSAPTSTSPSQSTGVSSSAARPLRSPTWNTPDNYSFRLDIDNPVQIAVTGTDIASQKPGQAALTVESTATGTLQNITGGHNAPINDRTSIPVVMPGWNSTNAICDQATIATTPTVGLPIHMSKIHMPPTGNQPSYGGSVIGCAMGGLAWQADATELSPGGSTPVTATRTDKMIVPENSVATFKATFAAPDFWLLTQSSRFAGCVMEGTIDGSVVIATIQGTSGCPNR